MACCYCCVVCLPETYDCLCCVVPCVLCTRGVLMLFERCIFVSTVFCNWVSSSDAFTCFVSEILCMTVVSAWDFGGVVKAVSGDYIRWLSVS